jgi:hypothetical protein
MDSSDRLACRVLGRAGGVPLNKQDMIMLAITWGSVLVSCGIWWLVLLEVI